jgi:hypothetical protein
MAVKFNQVFNMGANVGRLKFLYLGPKNKVLCYNKYFCQWIYLLYWTVWQVKKTYNSKVCIKGSTSNDFEDNSCRMWTRNVKEVEGVVT